ncbi:MAG: YfhH family protein [Bacilli bacterium]
MQKKYSEMTPFEIENEIRALRDRARRAESLGYVNEFEVLTRKVIMAESYLLNPNDFIPGETYDMKGSNDTFKITYMNGRFAWGMRSDGFEEEGVPIALLQKKAN